MTLPVLMNGMEWIPTCLHLAQLLEPCMELNAGLDFLTLAVDPLTIPFEQPTKRQILM